ncbi:FAD-dependent oxidoreductase [Archangium violaceum]|uniref:D-amino-acid oxidase n=1 Tax=Archangium violaceum Cb vi76 TaxID=1406225 RepID=A0A084SYB6_9BACT|nr:FAD-dependent oxidoreductase [Archangium violaceum]KFA93451.1 amino acid oxidase [Archangium violaceum Cb vi76]
MRVVIFGCGVSGLSCGVRLLEAGHAVEIWARELPPHTTSDVAAAVWYPYLAFPQERVTAWGARTLAELCALAARPETGVRRVLGTELLLWPAPDPWWASSVPGFRRATASELLPGFVDGFVFEAPVIDMRRYLPYLMERFRRLGGSILQREVRSLDEAWAVAPLVVNCTGLGSRTLLGDETLYPIRGEVLRVAPLPLERFLLDEQDEARGMTYLIPRIDDCILGGTAVKGSASLEPDPAQAEAILARAARLLPAGTRIHVSQHLVGLRPGRPAVRLELEQVDGRHVLHNYGHGGAGVTLSWGCAEEVAALAGQLTDGAPHVGPAHHPSSIGRTHGK